MYGLSNLGKDLVYYMFSKYHVISLNLLDLDGCFTISFLLVFPFF